MLAGRRTILIQAPTGSGKTMLTAHMLKNAATKGLTSFFNVHRRELVKQSIRTFDSVGVPHGVVAAGFMDDPRHLVQICSVQSLARRWQKLKRPKLIIWDEAHHCAAAGWARIFEAMPDAFHIGLTATPERLDGTGLGKYFSVMVKGPPVHWLIENGFLSPYKMYAPTTVSLQGIRTQMGDFSSAQLTDVMDKPSITGDAVREYSQRAAGKRAVVFCVSVEHSKHVASQFAAAGFRAEHVDGETPTDQRDATLKRFESGQTQVLTNVDLFGEGFDLPALEVSILLRPTQSLGLYLQQVGRALRPSPGKTHAIILDHAGNCVRHGLPDEEREWSLDSRPRRERTLERSASVKICPKCFSGQFAGPPACLQCGAVFEIKNRVIDEIEGDLEEVSKDTLVRRKGPDIEKIKCETLDQLIALGRQRGYKRPEFWARHVYMYRKNKRRS